MRFTIFFAFLISMNALSLECIQEEETPELAWKEAHNVFVGYPFQAEYKRHKNGAVEITYQFKVEKNMKGDSSSVLTARTEGAVYQLFQLGQIYAVFTDALDKIDLCDPNYEFHYNWETGVNYGSSEREKNLIEALIKLNNAKP
ncbi:hypothetical protein [Teredinibacter purpureus]|uniref:hypothetical protein n=1 Tax=Teredinibacter purpureus TaxID=2731756 RepID=UPI0005F817EB|nr:hypothetical protein [Teredinibacter purpureus]